MNRFIQSTLAVSLVAFSTQGMAAKSTFNTQQRKDIQDIVHQYLVQKPEVLMEAMQELQKKQYEQAEKTIKTTQEDAPKYVNDLFHRASDPVAGNPNGTVTVVEFFDYQCPHCVEMAPVIDGVLKTNKDLRIVFKEFPIRGPLSELAARASLAANKQGKYNDMRNALLANNKPLSDEVIFALASANGINVETLKKDMHDQAVDQALKDNMKLAQDLKLFGTPAFFIGKTNTTDPKGINYIPGRVDEAAMQKAIDSAK